MVRYPAGSCHQKMVHCGGAFLTSDMSASMLRKAAAFKRCSIGTKCDKNIPSRFCTSLNCNEQLNRQT